MELNNYLDKMYKTKFMLNNILRITSLFALILFASNASIINIETFKVIKLIKIISYMFMGVLFFTNKRTMSIVIIGLLVSLQYANFQEKYIYYVHILSLSSVIFVWVRTLFFVKIKYRFLGKTL